MIKQTKKVLLVDDDETVLIINKYTLEQYAGYDICTAMNLAEAKEKVISFEPDLIVLDVMLPDGCSIDFLTEFKQSRDIPILLLTSLTDSEDEIRGLTAGGDDYLVKPCDSGVLLARIETLLRLTGRANKTWNKGSLALDLLTNRAYLDGRELTLTGKEFIILRLLADYEGEAVSPEHIYEVVWGLPMGDDRSAVRMAISRLRKKIEPFGYDIFTERGRGYVFEKS